MSRFDENRKENKLLVILTFAKVVRRKTETDKSHKRV